MVQPALALADGHQVNEGLGGVVVAAVPGVDHRDGGVHGGPQRRALLGVAHGDDVGVAAHHPGGVGHRLPLGGAGLFRPREAQGPAPQPQHGGFKGEAGPGAGLIEQGGQPPALGGVGVGGGVRPDPVGQVQHGEGLGIGEVGRFNQMSHAQSPFVRKASRSGPTEIIWMGWPIRCSRAVT